MIVKVKLRKRKISGGRESLYLDFYPPVLNAETGDFTRREFLNLYVFENNNNPLHKRHNKEALQIAEQCRQKRENNYNKPEIYTEFEKEQLIKQKNGEKDFVEYFESLCDKRKTSNHDNWVSAYGYLVKFTNGVLRFSDVDEKFCNDFKDFLLNVQSKRSDKRKLSQNSAVSYFNKLKATLKQAYKDGLLSYDLNSKISCIDSTEIMKQTLTIEELRLLAKSECRFKGLKNIVLFAGLTGLPYKEMQNLLWKQVEISESFGIRIKMVRQKTGKPLLINISEQALQLMGERGEPDSKVFKSLNNKDRYYYFPLWLAEVGIKKTMTFHDLRHTYGCLQIEFGVDVYTLQGNMGHSTPRQTMMYGKISDMKKREAADKIKIEISN
jgi:integrase